MNQFQGTNQYNQGNRQFQQQGVGYTSQTHSTGAQAMFQPGFAGTNAQQVRRQNQQSVQSQSFQPNQFQGTPQYQQRGNQFQQQGNQFQQGVGYSGQSYVSGQQAIFQPGFAGTNAQQVRQQNQQSTHGNQGVNQYQGVQGNQFQGNQYQQVNQFQQGTQYGQFGSQSMFQPGFAGTDPQQVRQDIANEGGFGNRSSYQQF